MLMGQNLDWNQVLVSLKNTCKEYNGFALLFKVFHEQVSWTSVFAFLYFLLGLGDDYF